MRTRYKIIVISIIFFIIGLVLGVSYGAYTATSFMLDKAQLFLNAEGINMTINTDMIKSDLMRYKGNIGQCIREIG